MSKTIQLSDAQYAALQAGESITISAMTPPKPRTMKYTVERPEPMREHPEKGQRYWAADPTRKCWATIASWSAQDFDLRQFNRGLVYATQEEAVAAAKAMLGGE